MRKRTTLLAALLALALLPACGQGSGPEPSVPAPPTQEEMQRETRQLSEELAAVKAENEVLRGYIDGMRDALRYGRKINIYAGGDDHGHRIGAAPSAANPEL